MRHPLVFKMTLTLKEAIELLSSKKCCTKNLVDEALTIIKDSAFNKR